MHLVLLGLNEEFNILSMNITMKQFHQPVFRSLALGLQGQQFLLSGQVRDLLILKCLNFKALYSCI